MPGSVALSSTWCAHPVRHAYIQAVRFWCDERDIQGLILCIKHVRFKIRSDQIRPDHRRLIQYSIKNFKIKNPCNSRYHRYHTSLTLEVFIARNRVQAHVSKAVKALQCADSSSSQPFHYYFCSWAATVARFYQICNKKIQSACLLEQVIKVIGHAGGI
jgi:hypothetical protein